MTELLQNEPWIATALLALAAVVGALIAHRIGGAILRRAMRRTPLLPAIAVACDHAAGAALPLLALRLVWQAAADTLRHIDSVRHLQRARC
jgi:hypothetical protein